MGNSIFLIIIAILIVLSIWYLTVKYFLNPLFFKPKIKTSEIIDFLNKKECLFIEYKALNKEEKQRNIFNQEKGLTFDNIFSTKSEYKIIGFSQNKNKHKIYWAELKSWYRPFGKRILNLIEEKDVELLDELQKEYNQEIIKVTDKCPACNSGILTNETECKNCGLNLVA
ncbi:hypothetical protein N7U66_05310 [Lacinutrix neustonica]|uniref:Uncharacterized protein n=1 Tax=Lacinutrix neustonica TaxID=2980107 RepID=A0A9E8SES4_9FLAO|nr:hypothetical protein [Lacinutrix neustonica]WAC02903.1 hypothetical protein N7U66_04560 [Lacinutrix neustonica]WAC02983.1 hypothetical protein N7U66_04970 [Lacinutrix neustonica]WAC03047.1 hypothetical protein N7U66_05310 [Lacinutrix neustonica]